MALHVTIGGDGALFVGEDKTLRLHVLDTAGASVDITGWAIRFVVRLQDPTPDPPLLDKSATISGSFSPTNNPQRAVVVLADTEMGLTPKVYRHSWKRIDDGSETVLAWGNFIVQLATQI